MTQEPPDNDVNHSDQDIVIPDELTAAVPDASKNSWLKDRIDNWRESGLISREQAESILIFESVPETPFRLGMRFNRLLVVLSTLGAILIGTGIISFVAANWQGLPSIAKLVLLVGGQVGAFGIAYQLQFVRGYPKVGEAVMLVGAAWFGANIFLIAQSYHLSTDNPDLMLGWFLGVSPLAYITRSKSITVLAVAIFTIGVAWKAAEQTHDDASALIVMATLLLAGTAIYAIGLAHLGKQHLRFYAGPYLVGGALLAIAMTYVLSFDDVVSDFPGDSFLEDSIVSAGYLTLAAIVSAITFAALIYSRLSSDLSEKSLTERFAEPAVIALLVVAGWFVATHPFDSAVPYVLVFNLLLVLLIFGTIVLGIVNKREALVNVGIVFFVIDLMTRYIELTIDMLDTSLVFIIGGVLLLGVGYGMERGRRKLLRQYGMMEERHDS